MGHHRREPQTFSDFRFTQPEPPATPTPEQPYVTAIQVALHHQSADGDQQYWWPGGTPELGPGAVPIPDSSGQSVEIIPSPSANTKINMVQIAYRLNDLPEWHRTGLVYSTQRGSPETVAFCINSIAATYDPTAVASPWTMTVEESTIPADS